jgi:hypothetical protein
VYRVVQFLLSPVGYCSLNTLAVHAQELLVYRGIGMHIGTLDGDYFLHDNEGNPMIIRNVFHCDKCDGHHFTIRNMGTHVGLVVKLSHSSIDQYKSCRNPNGVHKNPFLMSA